LALLRGIIRRASKANRWADCSTEKRNMYKGFPSQKEYQKWLSGEISRVYSEIETKHPGIFDDEKEATQQSVQLTALRRGLTVSIFINVILLVVALYAIGGN
jgi:hypothetical protein